MSIKAANLRAITDRYFGAAARRAAAFLDNASPSRLARALESHLLHQPSARSIAVRDDVDCLLRYYSVLELAWLTNAIDSWPEDTAAVARHLKEPFVRRYYERYYPLLLPQLLRHRLEGSGVSGNGDHTDAFLRLVDLDELRDREETPMFLWFLDDGTEVWDDEEYGLTDALKIIVDGDRFVKRLTLKESDQTPADRAVRGFINFLAFSRELEALLDRLSSDPIVQSAFWHHHGYWYQQLGGQVLGVMTAGIEAFRGHVSASVNAEIESQTSKDMMQETDLFTESAIEATHRDMNHAVRVLQRLTSSVYRFALESYLYGERAALEWEDLKAVVQRRVSPVYKDDSPFVDEHETEEETQPESKEEEYEV